jgi:hypothetical protein
MTAALYRRSLWLNLVVKGAVAFGPGNGHQVPVPSMGVEVTRFAVAAVDSFHTQLLPKG